MSESTKLQSVLVTGAASGIGRACALKLLADGHQVVALDLNESALKAALPVDSVRLVRFAGDVSMTDSCRGAIGGQGGGSVAGRGADHGFYGGTFGDHLFDL